MIFQKKEKKPVNALYCQNLMGSMYRHGSKNKTLYFEVQPDPEAYASDPLYHEYFDEIVRDELYTGIIHKFIVSQPLLIHNDRLPFLIFKSNIDTFALNEFVKATVQELDFHTALKHSAQSGLTDTVLMQMDKNVPLTRSGSLGEKLSASAEMESLRNPVTYDGEPQDNGIMTPFDAWKAEKARLAALEDKEQEEIVEW